MPDQHALLSPSAAKRWMNCPAAAMLERQGGTGDESSVYALEGTFAHEMGQAMLLELHGRQHERPFMEIVRDAQAAGFDASEMEACVRDNYVSAVEAIYKEEQATDMLALLLVEQRVAVEGLEDTLWGTSDAIVISAERVHVIDLKYGKGVRVDAAENPQLRIYAAAALHSLRGIIGDGVREVHTHIIQPRLNHCTAEVLTVDELDEWVKDTLLPAARMAEDGTGPQVPGEWCRFCKVQPRCRACARLATKVAGDEFFPGLMNASEIGALMGLLPMIKKWCASVEDYAQAELLAGRKIPGYKLVEGRSVSRIENAAGAAMILKNMGFTSEQIYEPLTLKGVTALKKLLGTRRFATLSQFIVKPAGKPAVVPEDDPREEWSSAQSDFKNLLNQ